MVSVYQRKLKEYEETLLQVIQSEPTLSERTLNDLRDYQQHLNLTDEDVAPLEQRIIVQRKDIPSVDEIIIPTKVELANQLEFEVVRVNAQGKVCVRTLGRAEFFTEDLGNGILLEIVAIPGGQFLMGSPENELERDDSESPQHTVTIQPFFIGKYPITQAQWQAVATLPKVKIDLNPDPSRFKGANRPVEHVSWDDAVEFCDRLAKKTGQPYRLPSEAEWEYACRAGTTTPFHFGETITTDLASYDGRRTYGSGPQGLYRQQTKEVGKFSPNTFGLYDMHGNVYEWCKDTWHDTYKGAPVDGTAWISNNDNDNRLLRGGSWLFDTRFCRSADRDSHSRNDRNDHVGLRVAVGRRRT